jgi:hypothetical protein
LIKEGYKHGAVLVLKKDNKFLRHIHPMETTEDLKLAHRFTNHEFALKIKSILNGGLKTTKWKLYIL